MHSLLACLLTYYSLTYLPMKYLPTYLLRVLVYLLTYLLAYLQVHTLFRSLGLRHLSVVNTYL